MRAPRPLLSFLRRLIDPILVQHQTCHLSFVVFDESDLGIYDFEEKVGLGFSEEFKSVLAGRLREKLITFAADSEPKTRYDLILSNVSIKNLCLQLDRFALLRCFEPGQRILAYEQVAADIVNVIGRVREHDDTFACFRIKP